MEVICREVGLEDQLTVGKSYTVLQILESAGEIVSDTPRQDYLLVGDNGERDRFIVELFEVVPQPLSDKLYILALLYNQGKSNVPDSELMAQTGLTSKELDKYYWVAEKITRKIRDYDNPPADIEKEIRSWIDFYFAHGGVVSHQNFQA